MPVVHHLYDSGDPGLTRCGMRVDDCLAAGDCVWWGDALDAIPIADRQLPCTEGCGPGVEGADLDGGDVAERELAAHAGDPTEGRKFDRGKDPWDLFPWAAATEIIKVLEHGRAKYAAENWRHVHPLRRRYFAALMRHVLAWLRGERNDPETGLHHLAHAGCCLLFILEYEIDESAESCGPALEPPEREPPK